MPLTLTANLVLPRPVAAPTQTLVWTKLAGGAYPNWMGGKSKHVKMIADEAGHIYIAGGDYAGGWPGLDDSRGMVFRYTPASGAKACLLDYTAAGVAGQPCGHCYPLWTWDTGRNLLWLQPGTDRLGLNGRQNLVYGALWTFDPANPTPGARFMREAPSAPTAEAYANPANLPPGSVIVAPTANLPNNSGDDVWWGHYFNGAIWTSSNPFKLGKYTISTARDGNPAKDNWTTFCTFPTCRYESHHGAFTIDTRRGAAIFYLLIHLTGTYFCDQAATYEVSLTTGAWTQLNTTVLPCASCWGMAYDSHHDQVVLFGGYDRIEGDVTFDPTTDALNHLYCLDRNEASPNRNSWRLLAPTGEIPCGRKGETFCYEPVSRMLYQTGGTGGFSPPWTDLPGRDGNEIFSIGMKSTHPVYSGVDSIVQVSHWNTAIKLSDGLMFDMWEGNHEWPGIAANPNNVRGYNPLPSLVTDLNGTARAARTGWARWANHLYYSGGMWNAYYEAQNDNCAYIYLPTEQKIMAYGRGVFDLTPNNAYLEPHWILGNRTPLSDAVPPQVWSNYVQNTVGFNTNGTEGFYYNPICLWLANQDLAIHMGGDAAGGSPVALTWAMDRKSPVDPVQPWRMRNAGWPVTMPAGGIGRWRNNGVYVPVPYGSEDRVYCGGGVLNTGAACTGFYMLPAHNLTPGHTPTAVVLANWPDVTDEGTQCISVIGVGQMGYYPLLVHDTLRNRLILIGWRIWAFDLTDPLLGTPGHLGAWQDITLATCSDWFNPPAANCGYPMSHPMGAYYAELDAIVYRGGSQIIPSGPNKYKCRDLNYGNWAGSDSAKWYQLNLS